MSIVYRAEKGAALTHNELDNNFSELEQRISQKANEIHTHSIENIVNLKDELDNKIDKDDDVNVPNGLLRLDPNGKIPCNFLNDCFNIEESLENLESTKLNKRRKVRFVEEFAEIGNDEDVIILINENEFSLDNNYSNDSRIVKIVRLNSYDVNFHKSIIFLNGNESNLWENSLPNSIELLYVNNQWYQIG